MKRTGPAPTSKRPPTPAPTSSTSLVCSRRSNATWPEPRETERKGKPGNMSRASFFISTCFRSAQEPGRAPQLAIRLSVAVKPIDGIPDDLHKLTTGPSSFEFIPDFKSRVYRCMSWRVMRPGIFRIRPIIWICRSDSLQFIGQWQDGANPSLQFRYRSETKSTGHPFSLTLRHST